MLLYLYATRQRRGDEDLLRNRGGGMTHTAERSTVPWYTSGASTGQRRKASLPVCAGRWRARSWCWRRSSWRRGGTATERPSSWLAPSRSLSGEVGSA